MKQLSLSYNICRITCAIQKVHTSHEPHVSGQSGREQANETRSYPPPDENNLVVRSSTHFPRPVHTLFPVPCR